MSFLLCVYSGHAYPRCLLFFLEHEVEEKLESDGNKLTTSTYSINLMIITTVSLIVLVLIIFILCTIRKSRSSANVIREIEHITVEHIFNRSGKLIVYKYWYCKYKYLYIFNIFFSMSDNRNNNLKLFNKT